MKKIFLLGLQLTVVVAAIAQEAVVKGTVLDDLGDPAIGATVSLVGSDPLIGTTTDFDGAYQLTVPAASEGATLEFSYIGLESRTITDVETSDGEVTFLDVELGESSIELETAVVTAQALQNTDIAMTKIRAGSDKILDGISSQQMSKLALSDAAQAMTKVVGTTIEDGKYIVVRGLGDRYSTAQLNGLTMPSSDPYRNSPQLDLVPSSLLDNIVTSKTFTPDQPGSFTGGNVNLQTKAFPDLRTFSVNLGISYNTQASFNNGFLTQAGGGEGDEFGYDDGSRELPNRLVAIGESPIADASGREINILSAQVEQINFRNEGNALIAQLTEEASDVLNTNFATVPEQSLIDHSIRVTYGNAHDLSQNRRLGYVVSGSYKRSFEHYADGTEAFYRLDDPNADNLNSSFNFNDTYSQITPEVSGFGSLSYKLGEGQTIRALGVYNHKTDIGARYLVGTAGELNIPAPDQLENRALPFLERSVLSGQLNGEHALSENRSFRLEWSAAVTRSTQDEPSFRLFANTQINDDDETRYLIQSASYSRPLVFFRDLDDDQGEVKLDLFKEYDNRFKWQIGGAYRDKNRAFSENIFEIRTLNRNELLDLGPDPSEFFVDENMGFIPETPSGRPGVANFVVDNTQAVNSYDGYERVSAGYAMGTIPIGNRLRFVGGARVEHTDLQSVSRDETQPDSIRIGSVQGTDLLPSANLVFEIVENMNLRASYTRTLARPNMREIARFPQFSFIGGPIFSGNPNLERSKIDNFDLRWERFGENGGLLSASGFYKRFQDPIVTTFLAAAALEYIFVNVPEAEVYGVELEANERLGNLIPALNGFTAGVNVSFIESRAPVPAAELARIRTFFEAFPDERPLQGQSPFIINTNLSFDAPDGTWDAALAFNVFGERLAFNGAEGTPDVYERPRPSLDLTARKEFGQLELGVAATNLLNPKYETFAEFSGEEFIYSSFRRGVTFGLSLSYSIRG